MRRMIAAVASALPSSANTISKLIPAGPAPRIARFSERLQHRLFIVTRYDEAEPWSRVVILGGVHAIA